VLGEEADAETAREARRDDKEGVAARVLGEGLDFLASEGCLRRRIRDDELEDLIT
jgi:hypothetical protein